MLTAFFSERKNKMTILTLNICLFQKKRLSLQSINS